VITASDTTSPIETSTATTVPPNAARKIKSKRSKRFIYFCLLAIASGTAIIEGMSWLMIAMLPHSAPRPVSKIYADQSAQLRAFLDTSQPKLLEWHPVLGWYYGPNFHSKSHNSNSKALRGTKEYATIAAPNVLRIAAFGSSIVYCSEVDDGDAWPALMEAKNPNLEVLNYGVGGYGTDQAYLRYLAEGADHAPRVVLIGFASDELGRTVNVYRRFIMPIGQAPLFKPRYLRRADGSLSLLEVPMRSRPDYERLLKDPSEIIRLGKHDHWYQPSVYENPLYDYSTTVRLVVWTANQIYGRYVNGDRLVNGVVFNEESTAFKIQLELFSQFAEAVRANGALPVVVFFPEKVSADRGLAGGPKLYDPLLKPLKERGIEFLDAMEAFRATGMADSESWYAIGGHYSPKGNAIVADWLASEVMSLVESSAGPSHGG
jgi:hypothetical protein